MADSLSIISSVGSAQASAYSAVQTANSNAAGSSSADTSQAPSSSSPSASSSGYASFFNQRIIQDPIVGSITEYLSANGSEVLSQTPGAVTVAYLRNGLQADGARKTNATTA